MRVAGECFQERDAKAMLYRHEHFCVEMIPDAELIRIEADLRLMRDAEHPLA